MTRKAYHPSELPEHLKRAVSEARVAPEHDHLNALMPVICPVCSEEIESEDGTESGGVVVHYVCAGLADDE